MYWAMRCEGASQQPMGRHRVGSPESDSGSVISNGSSSSRSSRSNRLSGTVIVLQTNTKLGTMAVWRSSLMSQCVWRVRRGCPTPRRRYVWWRIPPNENMGPPAGSQLDLGSIRGFRISFVELDVERGAGRRFDVMADAGNDRHAFARRCADSPRPLIDEQHRAAEHDKLGPCRGHMGTGQRRGNIGGVETGCAASRRGPIGNPWTVRRDEPRLRGRPLRWRCQAEEVFATIISHEHRKARP